ncbi:hypothetical protein BH20ACI1_BH20ACI1_10460 [soil metagenome]
MVGVGLGLGVGVAVSVGVGVGVGIGQTVEQVGVATLITMLSIRAPFAPAATTLSSEPTRQRNWTFCPTAAGGKLTVDVI